MSYLEKAGFGSLGSAPVVKCMFQALAGVTALDPVSIAEPLDVDNEMAAAPQPPLTDLSCMESCNAHTIYPGPVVTGRPRRLTVQPTFTALPRPPHAAALLVPRRSLRCSLARPTDA